jgi:hypothetical protein
MRPAEELGLGLAQPQDAQGERGIIVWRAAADVGAGFPRLAAEVVVVRVLHQRQERRRVEREAPARPLAGVRIFLQITVARGGAGAFGQAGEPGFVGDDQLPGVGGIEDIFRKFLGRGGKFGVEAFEFELALGREVRAAVAEIFEGFVEVAPARTGEGTGLGRGGKRLKDAPEVRVQANARVEFRDLGQHGVVRRAQGRGVANGIEVGDATPGAVERLGGILERGQHAGVGDGAGILGGDGVEAALRFGERGGDLGLDPLGGEPAPRRRESGIKEGHQQAEEKECARAVRPGGAGSRQKADG